MRGATDDGCLCFDLLFRTTVAMEMIPRTVVSSSGFQGAFADSRGSESTLLDMKTLGRKDGWLFVVAVILALATTAK